MYLEWAIGYQTLEEKPSGEAEIERDEDSKAEGAEVAGKVGDNVTTGREAAGVSLGATSSKTTSFTDAAVAAEEEEMVKYDGGRSYVIAKEPPYM